MAVEKLPGDYPEPDSCSSVVQRMGTKKAKQEQRSFEQFIKQRKQVALTYLGGESAPLGEIVPRTGEATFFARGGGLVKGAGKV